MASAAKVLSLSLRNLRRAIQLPHSARCLHTASRQLGAYDVQFKEVKNRLNDMKEDPGNQAKLRLYALYKQATVGKCNVPKPGMMDFVGKAKWDAWNALGNMTEDEAQLEYINYVNELAGNEADVMTSTEVTSSEDIKVEVRDKLQVITLNRPDKYNALKVEMYEKLSEILEKSADDKTTTMTVLTGAGDYYCSGNDLSNFMNINPADIKKMAEDAGRLLHRFVQSFIDFPKPLAAVVNGPAVGVSVTTLGLCDIVYATDKATFHTPFSALGQSPEGCSTVTFPRMMGAAKSSRMLLFNEKISAEEACRCNLVTEVFPDATFQSEVWSRLKTMAAYPPNSMRLSKSLIRSLESDLLTSANNREVELLVERWQSDECMNAIMSFFNR